MNDNTIRTTTIRLSLDEPTSQDLDEYCGQMRTTAAEAIRSLLDWQTATGPIVAAALDQIVKDALASGDEESCSVGMDSGDICRTCWANFFGGLEAFNFDFYDPAIAPLVRTALKRLQVEIGETCRRQGVCE